jgi:cell division septation protein DedD
VQLREEANVADQIQTGGGHGGLYFIVGALVVVVAIGAVFLFGDSVSGPSKSTIDVKIEAPKAPAKPQ